MGAYTMQTPTHIVTEYPRALKGGSHDVDISGCIS